jgi:hypothetical protein
MASQPDLDALHGWCAAEGVKVDRRLRIINNEDAGVHVMAVAPIEAGETRMYALLLPSLSLFQ